MIRVRRSVLPLIAIVCLLISAACSGVGGGEAKESEKLQVEVNPVQDVLVSGRAILIDAHITKGSDPIVDTARVEFEIWKKDSAEHDMITAIPDQDGNYRIKTLFSEGGEYFVKAHVENGGASVTTSEKKLVVQNDEMS